MNSLKLHYTEFEELLDDSEIKFDFIGITETGLKVTKTHDLKGYEQVECPAESSKGGVKLYFSNNIKNYTERDDLKIYKKSQLESKFIEVTNPNNKKYKLAAFINIQRWTSMNSLFSTQKYSTK